MPTESSLGPGKPAATLADFTSPGLIIPELASRDSASVIQELCCALKREKRITDLLHFYQAVLNRELTPGSDIETHIALPHARLPAVKSLSFALGRSSTPMAWGVPGGQGVRLVFLIAAPATDSAQYLAFISALARLARNSELITQLETVEDPLQMMEVLKQASFRSSTGPNAWQKAAA